MLDQLTKTVKPMPYCVFTTQERGRDHGPVHYVTFIVIVGTRTQVSQPVEIDASEYDEYLSLPGEWQEGDYWIDQDADYAQTVYAASYRGQ